MKYGIGLSLVFWIVVGGFVYFDHAWIGILVGFTILIIILGAKSRRQPKEG